MAELEKLKMYINGERVEPASGEYFETHNPFTGKPWAMVARGGDADANRAVEAAKAALENSEWADLTQPSVVICLGVWEI